MIFKHSDKKGFSLIELLVVVAIIAILAAIAAPNYQDALARSKVARFKGDAKAVELGVESYFSEWSVYPPADRYSVLSNCGSWYSQPSNPNEGYLSRRLTTPQAYLAKLPIDIWKNLVDRGQCYPVRTTYIYSSDDFNRIWYNYFYVSNCYALLKGQRATNTRTPTQAVWMISSPAADGDQDHGRSTASQSGIGEANSGLPVQYDPTNGTNTNGDLFCFGPGLGFGLDQ